MKKIMLCGRPNGGCCPYIREDRKSGIMYIVDGEAEIPFTEKQVQQLIKYLNER